ncbi:hypothetical protein GALL_509340 [mine drainage metagenome]|uniref:Uncharacterized protein n=1 Tax=mine drainage metagenome TaxID=410659 RepID=A0A1J5P8A7_9ZZZZ
MGETKIQPLGVSRLDRLEAGVAPFPHAVAHEPGAQYRQQGQRDHQRTDQREHHGVRHRLEQRPGRSGQDIDRQEAGDDHRDRIEQRAIHLGRGVPDDLPDLERSALARRHLAEDVFHHHHRAVDQDPEIHRADGQQVGRGMLEIEADEGEQQRQRDGGGDDQARAEIVEEEHQDHGHQQHAAQQVVLDGLGRQRDQIAAVVERHDLDVLGQDLVVELPGLRFDAL